MWKPVLKPSNATAVRLTISLDENLHDTYAERAAKRGRDVEQEIIDRLVACKTHNATQSLYLADDDLSALSQIAGRTIRSTDDLLNWARRISSLNVAGTEVELSERLLTRLETRCFGLSMHDMLIKRVTECLEEYVGLR